MSRFAWFLAGFFVGAWCAGLAMRWEQLRPEPPKLAEPPIGEQARALLDAWRDWERVDAV